MSGSALLTYATGSGSTREVAESIVATLRGGGLKTDLEPVRSVKSLSGYSAVILGAPLYMFHWHKAMKSFLARHQDELTGVPVAVFALGPIGTGEPKEWEDARTNLDQELAQFPWLKPVTIEMFGGRLDPNKLHFPFTVFMRQMPPCDLRDWNAIRTWANDLPEKLL